MEALRLDELRNELIAIHGSLKKTAENLQYPYHHLCAVLNGTRDDWNLVSTLSAHVLRRAPEKQTDPIVVRNAIKERHKTISSFVRAYPKIDYNRALRLANEPQTKSEAWVIEALSYLGL